MGTDMAPPESNAVWDWIGTALLGLGAGIGGSWLHDRIRNAVMSARLDSFLAQYQLDRLRDSTEQNRRDKENDRRHEDNQGAIREVATDVKAILRNGRGH